jgi:hypothetical protein
LAQGVSEIVVPLQGPANQILQLFIFENFEPLDVGDSVRAPDPLPPAQADSFAGTTVAGRL